MRISWTILVLQLNANQSLPVVKQVDILRQTLNWTRVLFMGNRRSLAWGSSYWKKYLLNRVILDREFGCMFKYLESWNSCHNL